MVQCNSCGRRCLFCIALFPWLSNNMGWKWQTSSLRKPHQHFIKGRTVIKLRLTDQNNQRTKSQPRSSGSSWVPVLWMENKDAFSRVPLKSVPFVTQHDIWCAVRIHSWLKTKCWKKNDFAQILQIHLWIIVKFSAELVLAAQMHVLCLWQISDFKNNLD